MRQKMINVGPINFKIAKYKLAGGGRGGDDCDAWSRFHFAYCFTVQSFWTIANGIAILKKENPLIWHISNESSWCKFSDCQKYQYGTTNESLGGNNRFHHCFFFYRCFFSVKHKLADFQHKLSALSIILAAIWLFHTQANENDSTILHKLIDK